MKRLFYITCFHASVWGILGFFITLLFGFLAAVAGLSVDLFYLALIAFAITGIITSVFCIIKCYKKSEGF